MRKILIVFFLSITSLISLYQGTLFAIECPQMPKQANKDWETEVNAAILKIGPLKGAGLDVKVRNITNDLFAKLPDSAWVYLEQMMLAAYCSTLRDDKTINEAEKRRLLKEYTDEVRKTIERKLMPPQKPMGKDLEKSIEKVVEKGHAKIIQTQMEIKQEFRNFLDATVAFQNKKIADLNKTLTNLYSQEVGASDEEARQWAIETLEKAKEFKKEMENLEEKRRQYNEELSKNLIAKVYILFDYIFRTLDSRIMAFRELKPKVEYEKAEKLNLFTDESALTKPYTIRTVLLPNKNRILVDCITGKIREGLIVTCPMLEFIEIVNRKKMQSFKVIPHYGGGSILIGGNEVPLKKEKSLKDLRYFATGEEMLTEQFKGQFNATLNEFFRIAYAR